jgi:hypothetical protein
METRRNTSEHILAMCESAVFALARRFAEEQIDAILKYG